MQNGHTCYGKDLEIFNGVVKGVDKLYIKCYNAFMATVAELIGTTSSEAVAEETRLEFMIQGLPTILCRDNKLRQREIGMQNDKGNLTVLGSVLHEPGEVIGVLVRKNGTAEPIVHERHVVALGGGSIAFVKKAIKADDENDADESK